MRTRLGVINMDPDCEPLEDYLAPVIRLRLIKVAARVIETASRVRIAFASACPDADIFRHIARALKPAPT